MATVVLKHKRATLERIEKYISDIYFTDVNLYGRIDLKLANGLKLYCCSLKTDKFKELKTVTWEPFSIGKTFQPLWTQHWIKAVISWDVCKNNNLYLYWSVDGAESLVYDEEGSAVQGLSDKRKELKVAGHSSEVDVVYYIQVSCTGLFGAGNNGMINPPDSSKVYTLTSAHLINRDNVKYSVYMDLKVIYDIAKECPDTSSLCYDALYAGNDIINTLTQGEHNPQSYQSAQEIAGRLFNSGSDSRDTVHAIGHCHIDSAWLWPYTETIRKVARSWSSTLSLFDAGHKFHFAGSQVVQYSWLKVHYPVLYGKLKAAIKRGQFVPVGGTWVEMDTNIPNGESLIRQFLYGQKFYTKEFGVRSNILWLPDTFGYSGQLPQIMKICDIEYFLSQKLSWNLTNTFPHHTFHWKGIDQSSVVAHFPPADTYESHIDVKDLLKSVSNNKDKGRTHDQMLLFGYGDGGGGPTPDMLHKLDRLQNVKGLPKVVRSTPDTFFSTLEKERLCEWWGELYFELHRGTYTTHAKLKENNRRCEFLLTELEFVDSHSTKKKVPKFSTTLEELWRMVLFNQFHDILPGSSIEQVFIDAMEDYKKFDTMWLSAYSKLVEEGTSEHVVNPYNWSRVQVVKSTDSEKYRLISAPPLYVGSPLTAYTTDIPGVFERKDGICICNKVIKAVFHHTGQLRSLVHKPTGRECISRDSCYGNQFVVFDDIPLFWDAWDVMEYHTETRREYHPTQMKVVDSGPLRVSLEITVPLGPHGDVVTLAYLDVDSSYLAFRTEVSWKASHKFLKVQFPLTVSATEAEYEIQSGLVRRPTHSNTSWDSARFEVSGHKWAHLGEPNFGVGLISKSKYGYSATPNTLTLSLLRSSKAPDGNADMGDHTIEYAVYPHSGTLHSSRLVQHALNFNHPLTPRSGVVRTTPLFRVDSEDVVVQAVKRAEVGDGLVVRLYEPYGNTVQVNITGSNIAAAFSINAVERDTSKEPLIPEGGVVGPLIFTPFQIRSFLLTFSSRSGDTRKRSVSGASPTKRVRVQ